MTTTVTCPRCGDPIKVRVTFPRPRAIDQHGRWVIHPNTAAQTHHCPADPQEDET